MATQKRYFNYADRHRIYILGRVGQKVLNPSAERLRDEIVDLMRRSSPSGVTVRLPDGRVLRRSAAGEPPAIIWGHYADSWKMDEARQRRSTYSAVVFSDLRVGRWILALLLEYGTSRMAARPHIRVALDAVREEIRRQLRQAA